MFVTSALRKEPMPVHGDGLQVRTFTFVDDAVRGTIMAIESPHTEGEILNKFYRLSERVLGRERARDASELVLRAEKLTDVRSLMDALRASTEPK